MLGLTKSWYRNYSGAIKEFGGGSSYTTYILSETNNSITLQNGNYLAICVALNPANNSNTRNFAGLYISNKTLVTAAGVFNGAYGVYAGVNPTVSNGKLQFNIGNKDSAIAAGVCILIKL